MNLGKRFLKASSTSNARTRTTHSPTGLSVSPTACFETPAKPSVLNLDSSAILDAESSNLDSFDMNKSIADRSVSSVSIDSAVRGKIEEHLLPRASAGPFPHPFENNELGVPTFRPCQHLSFVIFSETKRVAMLILFTSTNVRVLPLSLPYKSRLVGWELAMIVEDSLRKQCFSKTFQKSKSMQHLCEELASFLPRSNRILDDGAPPVAQPVDAGSMIRTALRQTSRKSIGPSIDRFELFLSWLSAQEKSTSKKSGLSRQNSNFRHRCLICCESDVAEAYSLDSCGHSVCAECWIPYLEMTSSSGQRANVFCPAFDTCETSIGLYDVAYILCGASKRESKESTSIFEKLFLNEMKYFCEQILQGRPCPSPSCDRLLVPPADATNIKKCGWNILLCQCGHSVCADCGSSPSHPGMCCDTYASLRKSRKSGSLQARFDNCRELLERASTYPRCSDDETAMMYCPESPSFDAEAHQTLKRAMEEYEGLLRAHATLAEVDCEIASYDPEDPVQEILAISRQLAQVAVWLREKVFQFGDCTDAAETSLKELEDIQLAHDIRVLMQEREMQRETTLVQVTLALKKLRERRVAYQEQQQQSKRGSFVAPSKLPMFAPPELEELCVMDQEIFRIVTGEAIRSSIVALREIATLQDEPTAMANGWARSIFQIAKQRNGDDYGYSDDASSCDPSAEFAKRKITTNEYLLDDHGKLSEFKGKEVAVETQQKKAQQKKIPFLPSVTG